ncbi:Susd and RagB outer membrane lipoprotein [Fodinibius roseus]|uniref:Susd and RagB outer membrane lipoprotein n=1 Tax=Fodinibius roseus TaxID=1194090 RepID=A0A1M5GSA9_9BACT|nr:SusD/RagB family nutrient-binding outer membrane lipoprotein [Fodinibius roseus]SHG06615.1 Susd and RagB outer membrane lipoprotein [Fodinibius roseus]
MTTIKMSIMKIPAIALLIILMVGAVSCTGDFTEMNTPDHELTTDNVDINQLGNALAQAQYSGMMTWYQVSHNLYAAAWTQYTTILHPSFPSANLVDVGAWSDATFTGFYTNTSWGAAANQLKFVEDYTAENEMTLANAVAKLWRVQLYHRITDYWGPIIYSEFGNGETSVPYDAQEDIYKDFFTVLDEVRNVLEQHSGETVFAGNDLVYNGNVDQYLRWANSLRLRLALRIAYVEPGLAQQEAEKAIADGVIENNDNNALLMSTENNINKLSSITYHTEFGMSATMQSIMEGFEDPRLEEYWQPCCGRLQQFPQEETRYVGARNGLESSTRSLSMASELSYVDDKWLPISEGGTNEPDRLMEAAEVYFLRAEGALRGWDMGGTAESLYDQGIRASLNERTEATATEIDNYINSSNTPIAPTDKNGDPDQYNSPPVSDIPVDFDTGGSFERKLEQIITQKWLALYPMNDWEAWTERRRTGYPRGYAVRESQNTDVSETELVRRLMFVPAEYSNNQEATENAVGLLDGPDNNATRVWWDAKPLADYPVPTDPPN